MRLQKFTKYEKLQHRENKRAIDMGGSGVFLYQNNTPGSLMLPKPSNEGHKSIEQGKTFQGDSYFQSWVGPPLNMLRLIEVIVPKDNTSTSGFEAPKELETTQTGNEMNPNENKLILNQPDAVTAPKKEEVKDKKESKETEEMLLTEEPLDGVEIILN